MDFPIFEIDTNKFKINVDTRIYNKEALNNALYKYTGDYYIHQQYKNDDVNIIEVIFERKDSQIISEINIKDFCNDLIDFQLRYDNEKIFGHIRNLIVEEAFKPVNK